MAVNDHNLPRLVRFITFPVFAVALGLQTAGIASSEWDAFRTDFFGSKINVHQSLWNVYDSSTGNNINLLTEPPDTAFKARVVALLMSGMGCGVVGLAVLLMTSFVLRLRKRRIVVIGIIVVVIVLCLISGGVTIAAVQLYETNYFDILNSETLKPVNKVPLDRYNLSWGAYISYSCAGVYFVNAIVLAVGVVMMFVGKAIQPQGPEVQPKE